MVDRKVRDTPHNREEQSYNISICTKKYLKNFIIIIKINSTPISMTTVKFTISKGQNGHNNRQKR